ncbi:hypothetical protein MM326_18045 [Alkalihalobacillus sp. LMS6]|uniref:Ppx/GppA phosphatase family protein n=1 Tax=Alkalihalobacillus sp. LMS6 TaxID=2924034 RepID=UPI0020D00FD2|nr:hypothetical protein [Alkalihalobacillus sp. LMS6]UTR05955.1 hypothetical protein MM326_18045 [Alkalihalobacillus sp. LMS6]
MHYVSMIEIGSNSMKCTICKRDKGIWCIVTKKKAQVHLAKHLTKDRILKEQAVKKIIWALQQFKKVEEAYVCRGSFVFATGALRMARNQGDVLHAIKSQIHSSIQILSGRVEALLGYLALKERVCLETGIVLDTGGASTELTMVSKSSATYFQSYPFGALTLSNDFFCAETADWRQFVGQLKEHLAKDQVFHTAPMRSLITIGGAHHFLKEHLQTDSFSTDVLKQQLYELLEKAEEEFVQLKWIPKHRIASFKGGLLPLLAVIDVFPVSEITFHRLTITEGLIAALNASHKRSTPLLHV